MIPEVAQRVGTHGKAILLRLNSRLQSLIGFSSFLDRKSKFPHGISYFPRRKSQVSVSISHFPRKIPKFCTAFALSTRKIPKPHCISHLPRRKSQNSLSIRTFPSGKSEIPHGISNSPCEDPEFR